MGRLYYNASNNDGCYSSNFTFDIHDDPDGILTPIFLVERGNCTFVTKVRNVQINGGSLAVIIDNREWEDPNHVIMSDDGTGSGITIPSMMISKQNGEKLKQFLINNEEEITRKVSLTAEFIYSNKENHVHWELWYTSSHDRSLDFISNF